MRLSKPRIKAEFSHFFAVTNARFASLHGLLARPCPPLDRARSTSQTVRSSRASIRNEPQEWRASVCGSAAALRSGYVSLCAPLRLCSTGWLARPPTRKPKPVSAIAGWRIANRRRTHFGFFNQWL